jgi:ubiquitin C-terminal hydrolase
MLARQTSDVCYTNATVRQKEVSQFLKRKRKPAKKKTNKKKGSRGADTEEMHEKEVSVSLSSEVHNVLRVLWSGKWAVATPYSLVYSIWHFVPQFRSYLQQDAQEFYNYFIDAVHTELLQVADDADEELSIKSTGHEKGSPFGVDGSSHRDSASAALEKISRDARTFVGTSFQGCAGDQIECLSCGHVSKNQQIFLSLSVPIPWEHQGKSKVVSSLKRARTSIQKNKRELAKQEKQRKAALKKKKKQKSEEASKKKNSKKVSTPTTMSASASSTSASYGSASVRAARPRVVSSIGVDDDGEPVDMQSSSSSTSMSTTAAAISTTTATTSTTSPTSPTSPTATATVQGNKKHNTARSSRIISATKIDTTESVASTRRRRKLCSTSCSIQDCLASAHSTERLVGDSQYNCEKCGCKRDATKRGVISSLPHVLVLHIQRTKWPLGKLKDHVTFPMNDLDMKPYSTDEAVEKIGSNGVYELVGVVNHHGQSMDKGHYTSFCRDADRTTWIFYNDKEVGVASPEDVLVSQGFLLFYEIKDGHKVG